MLGSARFAFVGLLALCACGNEFVLSGSGSGGGSASGSGGDLFTSTTTSTGGMGGAGPQGPVPIEVVQTTTLVHDLNANEAPTLAFGVQPQPGNTIIVAIACFSEVDGCTIQEGNLTDNNGNSYDLAIEGMTIASQGGHGTRPSLFVADAIAVTQSTFELMVDPNGDNSNNQLVTWSAMEVAGLAPDSLDQTGRSVPDQMPDTTVETEATTQNNELAVALWTARQNEGAIMVTPDQDWTAHHENEQVSVGQPYSLVSTILDSTIPVTHTWEHPSPSRGALAVIATFKGEITD